MQKLVLDLTLTNVLINKYFLISKFHKSPRSNPLDKHIYNLVRCSRHFGNYSSKVYRSSRLGEQWFINYWNNSCSQIKNLNLGGVVLRIRHSIQYTI
ncbi:hypothetical protein BpHYR1_031891 [Brachionus plicatilis]|uniref:Uncharacterized protein n=1 Tax=Brachionus plicatilis TaxID=10195 RepID=A0A3M7SU98_BRAPC|nr:hypothetical protein BpHYR1_031891 [Brachionus plicatilis]